MTLSQKLCVHSSPCTCKGPPTFSGKRVGPALSVGQVLVVIFGKYNWLQLQKRRADEAPRGRASAQAHTARAAHPLIIPESPSECVYAPGGGGLVGWPSSPRPPHRGLRRSLHLACRLDLSPGRKITDFLLIFSQLLIHMLPSREYSGLLVLLACFIHPRPLLPLPSLLAPLPHFFLPLFLSLYLCFSRPPFRCPSLSLCLCPCGPVSPSSVSPSGICTPRTPYISFLSPRWRYPRGKQAA